MNVVLTFLFGLMVGICLCIFAMIAAYNYIEIELYGYRGWSIQFLLSWYSSNEEFEVYCGRWYAHPNYKILYWVFYGEEQ